MLRSLLAFFALLVASTQAAGEAPPVLVAVLAVSRHSIKSFIKPQLAAYTTHALNTSFGAPNGQLTPHGKEWAALVGRSVRAQYADLLGGERQRPPSEDCLFADSVAVMSDTDARDVGTGNSLLLGMAGGVDCGQRVTTGAFEHSILREYAAEDAADAAPDAAAEAAAAAEGDVLPPSRYKGSASTSDPTTCSYASEAEVAGLFGGDIDAAAMGAVGEEMRDISALVGCCNASLCGGAEGGKKCTLAEIPNTWEGGNWNTWSGGLQVAAWFAVTFQTQYLTGMPVYANLTSDRISRLYRVAQYYWSTYKNPINMNRFGGNLISFIAASLERAATGRDPTPGHVLANATSRGKASFAHGPKLQWLMGHDVNVAFLREFLEVHGGTPGYVNQSFI